MTNFQKRDLISLGLTGLILLVCFGAWAFLAKTDKASQPSSTQSHTKVEEEDLPQVSRQDWELILVNREHITPEFDPQLAEVSGIYVDERIADQVAAFLAAAKEIDPNEHLISGYRSVAYQAELYQSYINQEMANDPGLSIEEAEELVQTYSQPAGASEHQTGLAIDMSTVDQLNASDPAVAKQVQAIAPTYGFILRFPQGKSHETGVGYEDWHFRYVGQASAQYMTENDLTLEAYIERLEEKK